MLLLCIMFIHTTNFVNNFFPRGQFFDDLIGCFLCNNQHHTNSTVKSTCHLVNRNIPKLGKKGEDGRHSPAGGIQGDCQVLWETTRDIFQKTPSSDMSQTFHRTLGE
eukprot:Lithocolla_globosa_v1_NODE_1637_length_2432_cov_6.717711.p2 type:complete len:107 gc:universal NODE_1637_length_2432_cov_6.717711:152-472(+)